MTIYTRVLKKRLKSINKTVFTGYIVVKENGKYLWSRYSSITSLNKEDALEDAENLKSDVLRTNSIWINRQSVSINED